MPTESNLPICDRNGGDTFIEFMQVGPEKAEVCAIGGGNHLHLRQHGVFN